VQEILATMQAFGISVKDLQGAASRAGAGGKKSGTVNKGKSTHAVAASGKPKRKSAGTKVPPKFRGPGGEVWSGRGLMPRWLSALVASGRPKEDFAVS
jgi:DNA-binding protein H-NS